MTPESTGPFRKSSYSGAQGDCVEVAPTSTGGRAIRDSKDQHSPHLHVTPASWHAFLAGAKNGSL
ncbi:DUF397 domain-containing protein [Streptomyces sp. NPDC057623]|uniref:DUF397 domain-containing protein n=1 Tax=Streptomyces sp. NPDC057623 TaxID=3346187 RepID=UPI0036C94F3E